MLANASASSSATSRGTLLVGADLVDVQHRESGIGELGGSLDDGIDVVAARHLLGDGLRVTSSAACSKWV